MSATTSTTDVASAIKSNVPMNRYPDKDDDDSSRPMRPSRRIPSRKWRTNSPAPKPWQRMRFLQDRLEGMRRGLVTAPATRLRWPAAPLQLMVCLSVLLLQRIHSFCLLDFLLNVQFYDSGCYIKTFAYFCNSAWMTTTTKWSHFLIVGLFLLIILSPKRPNQLELGAWIER